MRIIAYFQPMGPDNFRADNIALTELWKSAWIKAGLVPQVIRESDIMAHPRFDQLRDKASKFPTLVGKEFSTACFTRWAMSHLLDVGEWAVAADYDVFPTKSFTAGSLAEILNAKDCKAVGLGMDIERGPGFMIGDKVTFDTLVDRIISYDLEPTDLLHGQPHVADMDILRKRTDGFTYLDRVRCYGREGWNSVPMCHFGNGHLKKLGEIPKWKEIEEALAL